MELATAAQVKYINQLIADWELTDEQTMKVLEHIGATSIGTLTKGDASMMIDTLKGPIGHIIRPEDYVGKDIYGEPINEEPEEDEDYVEHAQGCLGEWEGEECVCGTYDAYLKNLEAKESGKTGDGPGATGSTEGADAADDSDIPAAYRTTEYKGLTAGTRLEDVIGHRNKEAIDQRTRPTPPTPRNREASTSPQQTIRKITPDH